MQDLNNIILDEVSASIFIYQGEYNVFVNKYACELTEYSREELLSLKFWEILHPDFKEIVRKRGLTRQIGEEHPTRYQVKIVSKSGKDIWLEYFAKQISFRGEPAVLGTAYDITEAIGLKNSIKSSLNEKVVLIKEIHHRVKNNLQLCLSLVELHRDNSDKSNYQKSFQDLQNRIKTVSFLYSHLSEMEGLDKVRIKNYLQTLLDMIAQLNQLGDNNVKIALFTDDFELDLEHALPLGMIVNELVSNSFQHAFVQNSKAEIEVKLDEKDGKLIELLIIDNGAGLNTENLHDLSNSIGLQIVESFVQQLQGKMTIKSDKGTRIKISFS